MKMHDFVDEAVLGVTPAVLLELDPSKTYSLRKIGSKRQNIFVDTGDTVIGTLSIVDVAQLGKPGVKVSSLRPDSGPDYIRTSPVLHVKRTDDSTVALETEGGFYELKEVAEA